MQLDIHFHRADPTLMLYIQAKGGGLLQVVRPQYD